MDHEFFTEPPDNTLVGWDWFAIQLDNNQELMLYRLRRKSEVGDKFARPEFSSMGKAKQLLLMLLNWYSLLRSNGAARNLGSRYPVVWHISVPSLQLELTERTPLKQQELFSKDRLSLSYWEGAVTYTGTLESKPVSGVGYLEMTGYAGDMHLGSSAPGSK